MTVPSYTTDLADIITADNNTNWFEMTGHTGGGADAAETDGTPGKFNNWKQIKI